MGLDPAKIKGLVRIEDFTGLCEFVSSRQLVLMAMSNSSILSKLKLVLDFEYQFE